MQNFFCTMAPCEFPLLTVALAFCAAILPAASAAAQAPAPAAPIPAISLASDNWRFAMDPNDQGVREQWATRDLPGKVKLPGSMTESGLGDDITSATPWTQAQERIDELFKDPRFAPYQVSNPVKIPFWLTPLKYYRGAAWYQREFEVPKEWEGKQVSLYLERVHWFSKVWIDGHLNLPGVEDSLSVPHVWNLGPLSPGRHRLSIYVDNEVRIPVGLNAHSVTDHTQTNWNGIIGKIELRAHPKLSLDSVEVRPDASNQTVSVSANCAVWSAFPGTVHTLYEIIGPDGELASSDTISMQRDANSYVLNDSTATLKLAAAPRLWDEFSPVLYEARVQLIQEQDDGTTVLLDSRTEPFGFRDFATSGTEIVVNGRPTFLRGTLECCIFPLTGYPPTDIEPWRRIMRIIKAHGLNHLRFHSWCPPEAAFAAADEAGVYFSIEVASWARPGQDENYDNWLRAESERIVREYGNHPSFCMMLYGNEPLGDKAAYTRFLKKFVAEWKGRESRILFSGGAGWPALPNNDFLITPKPRIQLWGAGLTSRVNAKAPETTTDYADFIRKHKMPVISHEIGQWCVYPNLEERKKYTGVTRAYNFDIFADSLTSAGMAEQAHDFLMASGKLQALLYKEDIESALRTRGMGGFQLLDLHDFPGQGTALVGVLDPFWDSKGYISPEEYKRFAGPVVPLARLGKRVFTNDESLTCTVELANYSADAITAAPRWNLDLAEGKTVASGEFPRQDFPVRNGLTVGSITQALDAVTSAAKLVLTVSLPGTDYTNSWDVWVYPKQVAAPPASGDLMVTSNLDEAAMERLKTGGKVLLMAQKDAVINPPSGPVQAGFSSIFWNTAWTGNQAPHTLGILCDPKHPAFAAFPTEFHTNWHWWYLVHNAPVMLMDGLPKSMRPIIQSIDDWNWNRRLAYAWEANYAGGTLLVTTLPVKDENPVSRQLLHSLQTYMDSPEFAPATTLTADQFSTVLK
jgi:hypothetical protein